MTSIKEPVKTHNIPGPVPIPKSKPKPAEVSPPTKTPERIAVPDWPKKPAKVPEKAPV